MLYLEGLANPVCSRSRFKDVNSKLLSGQRRQLILEEIEVKGASTIVALGQKFDVSEMTIRRDLQALEASGFIERTHGGAVRKRTTIVADSYALKRKLAAAEKKQIARFAAENLVENGDIIIVEGGTTVITMIPYLASKKNLTVVTHSLYATNELQHLIANTTVICTGGILRDESYTFVGPLVERFFHEFHANKVFLSSTGFTLEKAFTDPSMLETQIKRAMIASADKVIVLLDSSKFGVRSLATVFRPHEIDILVTDDGAPDEIVKALQHQGREVLIAPKE